MSIGVQGAGMSGVEKLTDYYWWEKHELSYAKKFTGAEDYGFVPDYSNQANPICLNNRGVYIYLEYATSVNIDPNTGELSLVNPQDYSTNTTNSVSPSPIAQKYFKFKSISTGANSSFDTETIYFSADSALAAINSRLYLCMDKLFVVESEIVPSSFIEYVSSAEQNAFPIPSGTVGNYYYLYKGIPVQEALKANTKIEIGEYVGNGAFGMNNANEITLSFAPRFLYLYPVKNGYIEQSSSYTIYNLPLDISTLTTNYVANRGPNSQMSGTDFGKTYAKKSSDGKTISWYSTSSAIYQNNVSGWRYVYYAIG